jgi:Ca2+-binding RTX toxin-like protein
VARTDFALTTEATSVEIAVLANDLDIEGDPLELVSAGAQHGSVLVSQGTTLIYTPGPGFRGEDTITYAVRDPSDAQASATVRVTVVKEAHPATLDLDADDSSALGLAYRTAYTAGGEGVAIADADLEVADVDGSQLESAKVSIANSVDGDLLSVGILPGSLFAIQPAADQVFLYGTASLSDYETALRAITFSAPSRGTAQGARAVLASVFDGAGESQVASATIHLNEAPGLNASLPEQGVYVDQPFSVALAGLFFDPDPGDPLRFGAMLEDGSPWPAWLQLDPDSGTLAGVAGGAEAGSVRVRITAFDGVGASVSDSFELTVVWPNRAPVVANPLEDQAATAGSAFTFEVPIGTFSDPDAGDALTFSAARADGTALPAWLTFEPSTGELAGAPAPTQVGSLELRVTATDGAGLSASDVFTLTVAPASRLVVVGTDLDDHIDLSDVPVLDGALLDALAGNDTLVGTTGDDTLEGGDGNDLLAGGYDPDSLYGGAGEDTLYGNQGEDRLDDDGGRDRLYGDSGDDTLFGGEDNDTLCGDANEDVLGGGNGDDSLLGGTGADEMFGGEGNDRLFGGSSGATEPDVLSGEEGHDYLSGGQGPDALYGGADNDVLFGVSGDDLISGGFGRDIMDGGTGNDTLFGGANADLVFGGRDHDRLLGGQGVDTLYGGYGDDTLYGESGRDRLSGGDGRDALEGGSGRDWLAGGAGADTLAGGLGDDTLVGGAGPREDPALETDTFVYRFGWMGDAPPSGAVIGSGNDHVLDFVPGLASGDTLVLRPQVLAGAAPSLETLSAVLEVERFDADGDLLAEGTRIATRRPGTAPGEPDPYAEGLYLWGVLPSDGSGAAPATLLALAEHLRITVQASGLAAPAAEPVAAPVEPDDPFVADRDGSGGSDYAEGALVGLAPGLALREAPIPPALPYPLEDPRWWAELDSVAGTDRWAGTSGADRIVAASGDDTVVAGSGADRVLGGEGRDVVLGEANDDLLLGEAGQDTLAGGSGNDGLLGGAGTDRLRGGFGADTLAGEAGRDTLLGEAGADRLEGGADPDKANGGDGNDTLLGGEAADTLWGGGDDDVLAGEAGADLLYGEGPGAPRAGEDTLLGGAGADSLYGEGGDDWLEGGPGEDALNGGAGDDLYVFGRGDGADTLTESVANVGDHDRLRLGPGIAIDQLWLRPIAADLEVSVIGSSDRLTLAGWFGGGPGAIEELALDSGERLLASRVPGLIEAMASFAPPGAGETSLPKEYRPALEPVLAASWG